MRRFPFSVALVIVVETKIAENTSGLKNSVNGNQHGMRHGDISTLFATVYLDSDEPRGKEGIDCQVCIADYSHAEHGIALSGPTAFPLVGISLLLRYSPAQEAMCLQLVKRFHVRADR